VINIHDAYVNEHLNKFSEAMKRDFLYKNATCFMNNGMIWLLKVLKLYFVHSVLRFDFKDFQKAMKEDLPPLFSHVGLWIMENWLQRVKETEENKELERMIKVAIDIITKAEKQKKYFDLETKYHLTNKYSPKKCPEQK
jgi:ATP-dependent RNA circularization protein (DNA/RNA ligase family)